MFSQSRSHRLVFLVTTLLQGLLSKAQNAYSTFVGLNETLQMTENASVHNRSILKEASPGCVIDLLKENESRMTVPLVTFTASTIGNTIAIFVIWRNQKRSEKPSVFYTLIMTLALLDLVSTLTTSPITFIAYHNLHCVVDVGGKGLCDYSGFTMIFFGITSMALVFFMSIERFIAVRFAFFYQTKVTPTRTKIAVVLLLFFFLLVSAMPIMGFGEIEQQFPGTWCFLNWKSTNTLHQFYNLMFVAMGAVMMLGTIFCNLFVIITVVLKRKKMRSRNSTLQILSKQKLRKIAYNEIQMIVLLAVMTCVFVACYLPLLVRVVINQLTAMEPSYTASTLTKWDVLAVWMAAINPVLDPWVYILCRRSTLSKFVELLKMLITCNCSWEELRNTFSVGRDYKRRVSMRSLQDVKLGGHTENVPIQQTPTENKQANTAKYAQLWRIKASDSKLLSRTKLLEENQASLGSDHEL